MVRQRGTKIHPGENVSKGGDDTLFSKIDGVVKFSTKNGRKLVNVIPNELMFVDEIKLSVQSGAGGSGSVSFKNIIKVVSFWRIWWTRWKCNYHCK